MKKLAIVFVLLFFMAVPTSSMACMIKCGKLFDHTKIDHFDAFESIAHNAIQKIKNADCDQHLRDTCAGVHAFFSWVKKMHTCKKAFCGSWDCSDTPDDGDDDQAGTDDGVQPEISEETEETIEEIIPAALIDISNGDLDIVDVSIGGGGNDGGAAPVPEPATMLLLGTGLIGLAASYRKKKSK